MADRVAWYARRGVRAGTHTLSFEAVAATVGSFALPPAQALVVMQPEVMGLSAGGDFEVRAAGLTDVEMALPVEVPPNSCPGDGCSAKGLCDLVTGTCTCNRGTTGSDCSGVAPPLTMELTPDATDPTQITLVGLEVTDVDWVGASSDDERVVAASDVIIDDTTSPPTLRWSITGNRPGNATVTVVAVSGTEVVYRSFTAALTADGQMVASPSQFIERSEDGTEIERPRLGDGDVTTVKTSSAAKTEPSVEVWVVLIFAIGGVAAVWVLRYVCCLKQEGHVGGGGARKHTKLIAEEAKLTDESTS
jgi:hypothetical protein